LWCADDIAHEAPVREIDRRTGKLMIDPHTDTELERDDHMVATRSAPARVGGPEDDESDRGLVIARVIHRIGGGIRWNYNRNLAWGFAISIGVHLLVIGLYALSLVGSDDAVVVRDRPRLGRLDSLIIDTNLIAIDMSKVTVLAEGGSGGDVTSKEPDGLAKAGDPNAQPTFDPNAPRNVKPKVFEPTTPTRIKPVREKTPDNRPLATTNRDTAKGRSSGVGNPGQHADGRGDRDAGGNGGLGIGRGEGTGVGDGSGVKARGWLRAPSSRPFDNMVAEGKVTLRFSVLPNGEITNISPIKTAHPSLLKVAMERLRAAKVRPLPPGASPVTVTSQYTFNFKMPN
jgi:TonB family protein